MSQARVLLSWCLEVFPVAVSLLFRNVQNIQLRDSRSPELLEKVFLPIVIYFGLEMRLFLKEQMFVRMY